MDIFGAISGILLLIPVLIAALFPDFVLNNGFSYLLNLYNLAGLVILSAFGDYFYYKHAVKSIIKFRGSFQGDTMSDEYYQALAEKGKPSVLRAIIGCLAMVLCVSTILWLSGYFNKPIGII